MGILGFIRNVLKINSENDAQIMMPQVKETQLAIGKEAPSCKLSIPGEISEAELQELIRKRDKLLNGRGHFKNHDGYFVNCTDLYQKMITYSQIKDIQKITQLVSQNDDGECGLDIMLDYCAILYQPENHSFYAVLDEKGNFAERKGMKIPVWLPQNYKELVDNCTGLCYEMMMGCLYGQEKYMNYPRMDEIEKNIHQLCLEECMQFFMFYNRLSLRYGQQYFFEKWEDGTTLRVVKRMQQLRKYR